MWTQYGRRYTGGPSFFVNRLFPVPVFSIDFAGLNSILHLLKEHKMKELSGLTYLVTGANSGLGRCTVENLVSRGGSVILACRSEKKTRPVIENLLARFPGSDVELLALDLSDLHSVKKAAEKYLASGRRLDVLINNAGLAGARGLTVDGFEITIGTNHLGPFYFTELLLPRLREAPRGRMVNVASGAQMMVRSVDFSVLRRSAASARESFLFYGVSKLMNAIHAKELARRLIGTNITTYCLHPGGVATDVWRELPRIFQSFLKLFLMSEEKGARTQIYCATEKSIELESGLYYEKCREKKPNPLANDESLAKELFLRSEEAVKSVMGR